MAWQDYANKINSPAVLVGIAFGSGTRNYAQDYIRIAGTPHKGNILNLPRISGSLGDIQRTYERSKIILIFNDTDKEFRTLETTETVSFKNRVVTIKVGFGDDSYAAPLTLFTGYICGWRRLDNLRYEIEAEDQSINLENEYPDKIVELGDYANAHESAIGLIVPIPYGVISALGLSGDGAFGHPSLSNGTGLPFVDTTVDSEKHLVGRQAAAITVDRVYKNAVLQTLAVNYTIATAAISGQTHTTINWIAGQNPTESDFISCDITFGTRRPVEAIYHFLDNFCGYASGNFNTASFNTAKAKESDRGYDFSGALWERLPLRTILDNWRNEYEFDIYWNKSGEFCFNYLTALFSSPPHYTDLLHILEGYNSEPQVSELLNYLSYGYQFHYSKAYFYDYDYRENTDSQTEYGAIYKQFKGFYWVRTTAVARDLASRRIIRFKDPIVFDTYRLPLRTFSDDLADVLEITHFEGLGAGGHVRRRFQLRAFDFDLDDFTNEMILEDASSFMGRACVLGDGAVLPAAWADASGVERDYCYMCDLATGEFSDGEPGKMLVD